MRPLAEKFAPFVPNYLKKGFFKKMAKVPIHLILNIKNQPHYSKKTGRKIKLTSYQV
jgi:hypothetical protein